MGEARQHEITPPPRLHDVVGAERLAHPLLAPAVVQQRHGQPPQAAVLPEMVVRVGFGRPAGRELSGRHDVFSSAVRPARRVNRTLLKKTSGGPDRLAARPASPCFVTGRGITRTAGAVPVDIGLFRQRSETTSP
jgi:hypothetical protein